MTITIALADDHPVVRMGITTLLATEPDFRIVGEAGDGNEALRMVEREQPNVLILDLTMPGLSGLDVLRIVRQRAPQTAVIILSMHNSNAFIVESLNNGAIGYVLKGCAPEELTRAVRDAALGKRYLCPTVSEIAIDAYIEKSQSGPFDPHDTLTPREREVLQLTAKGKSSPEMAVLLHLSQRTIENHRAHLTRKLGLQNQSELVRYALRHGLISLDE